MFLVSDDFESLVEPQKNGKEHSFVNFSTYFEFLVIFILSHHIKLPAMI